MSSLTSGPQRETSALTQVVDREPIQSMRPSWACGFVGRPAIGVRDQSAINRRDVSIAELTARACRAARAFLALDSFKSERKPLVLPKVHGSYSFPFQFGAVDAVLRTDWIILLLTPISQNRDRDFDVTF